MKPKLLITTSGFPLFENDGESQFMLEYALAMQSHYDIVVLAPRNKTSKKEENWKGIQIYRHTQSPLFNIQLAYQSGMMGNIKRNPLLIFMVPVFILMQQWAIKNIVKKEKIDLINAHWIFPQGLALALMRTFGFKKPYILTVHSGTFWQFGKFPFSLLRNFTLKKANAVTCVSQALTEGVMEVCKKQVFHLPLGIDLDIFKETDKTQKLINQYRLANKMVITFVGTMVETKGVHALIQAFNSISLEYGEWVLMMIGDGKELDGLKHYAKTKNIEDRIIFTGKIDHLEIPNHLAISQLLCIPSYAEGFPMVVKESLAAKVLVLATELPVFKSEPQLEDIIFYVPTVEATLIAEKLREIIANIGHFEERKMNGRKYIEKNANWESIASKFFTIASKS